MFPTFVGNKLYDFFLHDEGIIAIRRGKISSLPKSIANDKTSFEKLEYAP